MVNKYTIFEFITTPFGEVTFTPNLRTKMRYDKNSKRSVVDEAKGSYGITIHWPANNPEADAFFKKIEQLNDAGHAIFPSEIKKKLPFKTYKTDAGAELLQFQVENPYDAPVIVDSSKPPVALTDEVIEKINRGSEVRLRVLAHESEGFGKSGIKLFLKSVQVKSLKENTFSGFDDVDGGYTAPSVPTEEPAKAASPETKPATSKVTLDDEIPF